MQRSAFRNAKSVIANIGATVASPVSRIVGQNDNGRAALVARVETLHPLNILAYVITSQGMGPMLLQPKDFIEPINLGRF